MMVALAALVLSSATGPAQASTWEGQDRDINCNYLEFEWPNQGIYYWFVATCVERDLAETNLCLAISAYAVGGGSSIICLHSHPLGLEWWLCTGRPMDENQFRINSCIPIDLGFVTGILPDEIPVPVVTCVSPDEVCLDIQYVPAPWSFAPTIPSVETSSSDPLNCLYKVGVRDDVFGICHHFVDFYDQYDETDNIGYCIGLYDYSNVNNGDIKGDAACILIVSDSDGGTTVCAGHYRYFETQLETGVYFMREGACGPTLFGGGGGGGGGGPCVRYGSGGTC